MGRRAKGEGTIFKRKDNRWSGQDYVTLVNGVRKRICVIGKKGETREDVRLRLREIMRQEERGTPYVEKDWTLGEYFDYWINEVMPNRVAESTFDSYNRAVNNYLKPAMCGHKLKNLSVQDVRNAIKTMTENGCPSGAMEKNLQVLVNCLNCAMREELIFRNVAQLVEKPKHLRKETVIWSANQSVSFLDSVKEHPLYIAFVLFFVCGMRRGEIIGLRWSDIDFENGFICVRQQMYRVKGKRVKSEIVVKELKTKNSRRNPPLVDDVRNALIEHAKKRNITIPPFNPYFELSKQGTVIVGKTGNPVDPRVLARHFENLTKKADLPRTKLHAMRHMTPTFMKDLGVHVKDAQMILGHANVSTTLNIYQHGTPEGQRAALDAMGNRLLKRADNVA
jgi:integrase